MTTIAVFVLKVTAVLLAGLAVGHVTRYKSASFRHAVLVATVLAAALLPALTRVAPGWLPVAPMPAPTAGPMAMATGVAVATTTVGANQPATAPALPRLSWTRLAVAAWLLVAVGALARLARDVSRIGVLARHSRPLEDPRWAGLLVRSTQRMHVRAPVALRLGPDAAPVVTWGVRHPQILVPAGAIDWPDAQVGHVLAHELAHIARRDWVCHLALAVVGALYAWHPLMRIAIRSARREAERACDDAVLASGTAASAYASTLLDVARSRRACPTTAAVAMAEPSSLEGRITAMLDTSIDHSTASRPLRALVGGTVVALTIAVAGLGAQTQAVGTIRGTVLPAGGTPLSGVTVTFTGATTVSAVTDAQGEFTASLPGGTYRAEIRTPGFKRFSARVEVAPGDAMTRDFALALGTVSESIVVSAAPAAGPAETPFHRPAPPQANPFGSTLEPPKKLKHVNPVYSDEFKAAGIVGKVVLAARIGVDGFVTDVQIVSSPHDGLSAAAVEAVEQWKYAPTVLQGTPVPTEMTVTVDFSADAR